MQRTHFVCNTELFVRVCTLSSFKNLTIFYDPSVFSISLPLHKYADLAKATSEIRIQKRAERTEPTSVAQFAVLPIWPLPLG